MSHIDLTHLPLVSYTVILSFLFAAGTTKGLIGVGMPVIAVPLLNMVLDLPATVALLSIPLVITNIPQAIDGDPPAVVFRRLAPIFIGLVVGVFAGISLLAAIHPDVLKPVVGLVLIAIASLMVLSPCVRIPKELEPLTGPVAGVISGLTGGLAAMPGPFMYMYLFAVGIDRDRFVQYTSMFLTVAATLMTIVLSGKGLLGWNDALISALAACPIFAGMWVGGHIRRFVSPKLFRKIILGVVFVSGLHLIGAASG